MRRKKRTGILTFLVFLIFVFSMVVWASDGIEGERMDTEDTETERVIRESEDRESQIQEESEGIAGETFTENDVETETGIEDSYVYDGEVFSEVNEYSARAVTKGKIDYTYWAIHQGAGFGNILEDGRDLDHVGCIMLKVGNTWKTAYCVHHNADLKGGHEYADTASYLTDSNKKRLTGLALYYGFRFSGWNPDKKTVPGDSDKGKYTATQVMIWMIERKSVINRIRALSEVPMTILKRYIVKCRHLVQCLLLLIGVRTVLRLGIWGMTFKQTNMFSN